MKSSATIKRREQYHTYYWSTYGKTTFPFSTAIFSVWALYKQTQQQKADANVQFW